MSKTGGPKTENFWIISRDIPRQLHYRLANAKNIIGIYFCSPWFSKPDIPGFKSVLHDKTRGKIFEVLTRPKEEAPWHEEMLIFFRLECNAKIYINPILHAKLYIVIAQIGSFAIFGSPNLTKAARSQLEVAILTYNKSFIDMLFNIFQIRLKRLCKYWR